MKAAAASPAAGGALRRERPIVLMYHRVASAHCRSVAFGSHAPSALPIRSSCSQPRERSCRFPGWRRRLRRAACPGTPRPSPLTTATSMSSRTRARSFRRPVALPLSSLPPERWARAAGFWWDVLARIVLELPCAAARARFDLGGRHRRIDVSGTGNGGASAALMAIHALLDRLHQPPGTGYSPSLPRRARNRRRRPGSATWP